MSIGETLAQARRQSGLSVTEVSRRTRIRETLVKDIERDDYAACGGDFYARGHIRAIARVVGADSEPLIAEYDAARQAPSLEDTSPQQFTPAAAAGWQQRPDPAAEPPTDPFGQVTLVESPNWQRTRGRRPEPPTEHLRPEPPREPPLREPPPRPPAPADAQRPTVRIGEADWQEPPAEPPRPEPPTEQLRPVPLPEPPLREPPPRLPADAQRPTVRIGEADWQEPPAEPPAEPPRREPPAQPPAEPPARVPYQYGPAAVGGGPRRRNWPVLFGVVLVVVLGFLGYYFVTGSGHPSAGAPAAGSSPQSSPSGSPDAGGTGSSAHKVVVHLTAVRAVSVVFTTPGGKYLFRATIPAGASKKWTFHGAVNMRLGNPGDAKLAVDGKNPLPHGSPSAPVTLTLSPGHPVIVATPASTPAPASTPTPAVPLADSAPLTPASATSFGTSGAGQGDNQQLAPMAIDGKRSTAWNTDWYASARFGNLYPGTGLLIDMGKPVTITSAAISLGSAPGANFQLRVGSAPTMSDLPTAARATDASGTVHLRLSSPAHGRYVLIWFTKLPLDASGNFEASVYNVKLAGRA